MANPPVTTPPAGTPATTHYAFTDRWGDVYADGDGYLYRRKEEYQARWEALQATSAAGDWLDQGTYYRSYKAVSHNTLALLTAGAASAAQAGNQGAATVLEQADKAGVTAAAKTVVWYALGTAALVGGVAVALNWRPFLDFLGGRRRGA